MDTTGTCGSAGGGRAPCACGTMSAVVVRTLGEVKTPWADGTLATPVGRVPRVRTEWFWRDRLGELRVRCDIGRMNYRVVPGVYAVGNPTDESAVFVSANYKLSFDRLRRALAGRDGWILALDTHGINVWCAAGKGTFSTEEIVRRVAGSGLARIVSHRRLVVPQLAATGVSAHEVRRACGFSVVYGPVRAEDLPAFLDARLKASADMRRVRFRTRDRAVLIPVEIAAGARLAVPIAIAFLLAGGIDGNGYSMASLKLVGGQSASLLLAAFLAAAVGGPLLLPWLPGRPFALKGASLGLVLAGLLLACHFGATPIFGSAFHAAAWALLVPTVTSFVIMNFTGSSTFTSLSGVLREMRVALPMQIAGAVAGLGLWVAGLFA